MTCYGLSIGTGFNSISNITLYQQYSHLIGLGRFLLIVSLFIDLVFTVIVIVGYFLLAHLVTSPNFPPSSSTISSTSHSYYEYTYDHYYQKAWR